MLFFILPVIAKFVFRPTPNWKRNNSVNGVKVEIKVGDDERKPIIKTYEFKEYQDFSKEKKEDIKNEVHSQIEGDLPRINLNTDPNMVFTFYHEEKEMEPSGDIEILLTVSNVFDYTEEAIDKDIKDVLTLEDGKYKYTMKRFHTQYQKYFEEYSDIELYYEVDGVKYVSLFGIYSGNVIDGTEFFDNEVLDEPKE